MSRAEAIRSKKSVRLSLRLLLAEEKWKQGLRRRHAAAKERLRILKLAKGVMGEFGE